MFTFYNGGFTYFSSNELEKKIPQISNNGFINTFLSFPIFLKSNYTPFFLF